MRIKNFQFILYFILTINLLATEAEFLKINTSVKSTGMGGGGTALTENIDELNVNIAGIAIIESLQLSFQHGEIFKNLPINLRYENLSVALPLSSIIKKTGYGVTTLQFLFFYIPSINGYNEWGEIISSADYYAIKYSMGYSINLYNRKKLDLLAGIQFNLLNQKINNLPVGNISYGPSYSLDLGTKSIINNKILVGVTLKNFALLNNPSLPSYIGIGISYLTKNSLSFSVDINKYLSQKTEFIIGIEYKYKFLFIRSGINSNLDKITNLNYSFGIGAEYKKFNFNYSLITLNEFGLSHRFGIIFKI